MKPSIHIKVLFTVLSPAAASMLPMSRQLRSCGYVANENITNINNKESTMNK